MLNDIPTIITPIPLMTEFFVVVMRVLYDTYYWISITLRRLASLHSVRGSGEGKMCSAQAESGSAQRRKARRAI